MSTIQITIPDALAEQMTQEEIRLFLEAQLQNFDLADSPIIPASSSSIPIEEEPLVRMWAEREDMKDSVEYVRNIRRNFNRLRRWEQKRNV